MSGSFNGGIWFLAGTRSVAATVILLAFRTSPEKADESTART